MIINDFPLSGKTFFPSAEIFSTKSHKKELNFYIDFPGITR